MNNNVAAVFITDEDYVMLTYVSIISAIKNKNKSSLYSINIIAVNISEKSKNILLELNSFDNNVVVNILEFNNKYANIGLSHGYVSKAALFKFDIANIFTEYSKMLYIDSDTVILSDLTEFFNIDVSNVYAGVVEDMLAVKFYEDNKVINLQRYFNSGVMLLNLQKIREDNIKEKLIEHKIKDTTSKFMDQDALNIVFYNHLKYLHPKYNCMTTMLLTYSKDEIKKFYNINDDFNITILHLTHVKSYDSNMVNNEFVDTFWHYYQLTPWFKENPLDAINIIIKQHINKVNLTIEYKCNELNKIVNEFQHKIQEISNELQILNTKLYENKYNTNWLKLFGIYNNKNYLKIVIFGISILFKMTPDKVNKIAWFIPIKKWRNNFRKKFE